MPFRKRVRGLEDVECPEIPYRDRILHPVPRRLHGKDKPRHPEGARHSERGRRPHAPACARRQEREDDERRVDPEGCAHQEVANRMGVQHRQASQSL